jgi:hypothetical protein
MKKLLFTSLITLVSIATPALAAEVTPINLVSQGYQGRLLKEGIPSYAVFLQKVHLGTIDGEDLIKGAIAQGKLSPELANSETYLNQVNSALFLLQTNGSSR